MSVSATGSTRAFATAIGRATAAVDVISIMIGGLHRDLVCERTATDRLP
jgi:hypothetical protein